MKTTVVGNYPKISSNKKAPNLRNSLNAREQKKITPEQLEQVYQETIRRVIREQEEAGIDIITDGQIRWDDLVTPIAKNISGFEIGGLIRFFDNNVYYRRPVVKSKLAYRSPSTVEQFRFAQSVTKKPVKVALPGPFTFAKLSLDEHYGSLEKLTLELAGILHQEAVELEKAGCKFIQLDEPSLTYFPEEISLASRAIDTVFENVKAHKILFLYFGKVAQVLPQLLQGSVDAVGVDLASHAENLPAVLSAQWNSKELILGCFDARNTRLEREEDIAEIFGSVSKKIPPAQITLSPSSGLEFLPQETALRKLRTLSQIAHKLN